MIKVTPEQRGHFLNEEQKQLKQKIMDELIGVMESNLNNVNINAQVLYDIVMSCIIMFSRETISGAAVPITEYEEFITHVTDAIKKESIRRTLELKRELN